MPIASEPKHVIRECDLILDGKLIKNQEQLNRWLVVQMKKLAMQAHARHEENAQIRRAIRNSNKFSKVEL
ncbi:MAG TPA: hypothetical protein VGF75_00405 [Candidatus Saccharimonadales bacterium]|jgi:hypothetical protein